MRLQPHQPKLHECFTRSKLEPRPILGDCIYNNYLNWKWTKSLGRCLCWRPGIWNNGSHIKWQQWWLNRSVAKDAGKLHNIKEFARRRFPSCRLKIPWESDLFLVVSALLTAWEKGENNVNMFDVHNRSGSTREYNQIEKELRKKGVKIWGDCLNFFNIYIAAIEFMSHAWPDLELTVYMQDIIIDKWLIVSFMNKDKL